MEDGSRKRKRRRWGNDQGVFTSSSVIVGEAVTTFTWWDGMRPTSQASADLIIRAIDDVRLMLANEGFHCMPEFKAEIKRMRRELKNAARIVQGSVDQQGQLFGEAE